LLAITGATGFVGSALLDAALAQGHHPRALARRDQARGACGMGARRSGRYRARWLRWSPGAMRWCIAGLTNTPIPRSLRRRQCHRHAQRGQCRDGRQGCGGFCAFVSSLSAREPELSAYGASKAGPRRW
jgi:hypothetical protein